MPSSLDDDVLEFFEMGSHRHISVMRVRPLPGRTPQTLYLTHDLPSMILASLASRLLEWPSWKRLSVEDQLRQYRVPLNDSFESAVRDYPSITINSDVMAGAPCIGGTRIPVYMVLDAVEYYGEISAALRSYPNLTIQQVKDAIGFAKLVVECPIDDKSTATAG